MPSATINGAGYSADIIEFMRLLRRFEVRCVVVGGEAVIYHGYPRFTGDVDFLYEASPANAARLFAALLEFWTGAIPGIEAVEELIEPGIVVQFGRPPNRIDLLSQIDGVAFEEAWHSRIPVRIQLLGHKRQQLLLQKADIVIPTSPATGRSPSRLRHRPDPARFGQRGKASPPRGPARRR